MTRRPALLLLLLVLLLALPQAAVADGPATIDDLFVLYDIDNVPADFVVVLDTSASMAFEPDPLWPPTVEAMELLLRTIPQGDHLSFLTFDSVATIQSVGDVGPGTADEVLAGLPAVPQGGATDIGAGIDAALRRLDRARPNPVQVVVLLTDGLHNPPPGSPFPADTASAPWQQLTTDAQAMEATRDILAFGIGIEGAGAVDITPLRGVFRVTEIVNLPPEQLAPFFEEIIERTRIARLRSEVERDLGRASLRADVQRGLELDGDRAVVTIDVLWDGARLPTTTTVDEIVVTGPDGTRYPARLLDELPDVLEPGESVPVRVEVELPEDQTGMVLGEATESMELDVDVRLAGDVEPREVLRTGLGLDPSVAPVAASGQTRGERVFGIPWWIVGVLAGLLVVLLLLLWWAYRRYLRLPQLSGALEFPDGTRIELRGTRMELPGDDRDLAGAGTARLELFTRRGERERVFVRALAHPVSLDRHGLPEPVTDPERVRYHDRIRLDRAVGEYVK